MNITNNMNYMFLKSVSNIARALVIAVVVTLSVISSAQMSTTQNQYPNFQPDQWDTNAATIEQVLESVESTAEELNTYRATLDSDRSEALTVINAARGEIAELENQQAALGTAPAEGEPEDPAVAERRAIVNSRLSRNRGILATARQADQRATNLIQEIDSTIRSNYSQQLLNRFDIPVLPSSVATAVTELSLVSVDVAKEINEGIQENKTTQAVQNQIWLILGLLVMGIFLFSYVRHKLIRWVEELSSQHENIFCRLLALFLDTFSYIAAYYIGARLIIYALELSLIFGAYNEFIINSLEVLVTVLAVAFWLAKFYFRITGDEETRKWRSRESLYMMTVGFILALEIILPEFGRQFELSDVTLTFVNFVLLVTAWPFLRALCMKSAVSVALSLKDSDEEPFYVKHLRRLVRTISFIIPVIALMGFYALSQQLFIGTVETLAVMLILLRVYYFISQMVMMLARWSKRRGKNMPDEYGFSQDNSVALWPVIVGAVLFAIAIPLVALIWGARWTDIREGWVLLNRGIPIGDSRISLTDLLAMIVIFVVGFQIVRIIQRVLAQTVMPRTRYDVGGQVAVTKLFGYIGYTVAALIAVTSIGIDLSSLAIVLGALSVGIGFGLQNIVSNFISGIILLVERPIKKGDWIEISSGKMGFVKNVAVRSTAIETFDRSTLIVPNADLISQTVLNWSHGNRLGRMIVPIHVAYSTYAHDVERILLEIAHAHEEILDYPQAAVLFIGYGPDHLKFELRAFLRQAEDVMEVRSDVYCNIQKRFAEEGIIVPITQHEIRMVDSDTSMNDNLKATAPTST